jgi:hypothetical protein
MRRDVPIYQLGATILVAQGVLWLVSLTAPASTWYTASSFVQTSDWTFAQTPLHYGYNQT